MSPWIMVVVMAAVCALYGAAMYALASWAEKQDGGEER